MLYNISIGAKYFYFINEYVLHAITLYWLYVSHGDGNTHK